MAIYFRSKLVGIHFVQIARDKERSPDARHIKKISDGIKLLESNHNKETTLEEESIHSNR